MQLKMWLIPLCPQFCHILEHLLLAQEEQASYLHQITFLCTPPHWPFLGACPVSGAHRSRIHPPRPSRASKRHRQHKRKGRQRWGSKGDGVQPGIRRTTYGKLHGPNQWGHCKLATLLCCWREHFSDVFTPVVHVVFHGILFAPWYKLHRQVRPCQCSKAKAIFLAYVKKVFRGFCFF